MFEFNGLVWEQWETFRMNVLYLLVAIAFTFSNRLIASEAPDENQDVNEQKNSVLFYRSPEERREAGLGRQVTDWLAISGLVEFEREQIRYHFPGGSSEKEKDAPVKTAQLAMRFEFGDEWESEIILEAEDDEGYRMIIDEVMIAWDIGDIGITFGRLYAPFGEFYSHFVVGPGLEFGETRATQFQVDYGFYEQLEVGLYLLESRVTGRNSDPSYDWGGKIEWNSEDESVRFGASYISDISEAQEPILEEAEYYVNRVDAFSCYALWGVNQFEFTAELVKALGYFAELEESVNAPLAYNLEAAYFPTDTLQIAFRYERSKKLVELPDNRMGINLRWLVHQNVSVSFEYLHADFNDRIVEEDEGSPLDADQFAAQLSIEF